MQKTNTSKKRVQKYKRVSLAPTILIFFVSVIISIIVGILALDLFITEGIERKASINYEIGEKVVDYIFDKKIKGEDYQKILEDYCDENDTEAAYIVDESGKIIAQVGEKTSTDKVDEDLLKYNENMVVYFDVSSVSNEENGASPFINQFMEAIKKWSGTFDSNKFYNDTEVPWELWGEYKLKENDMKVCVKQISYFSYEDFLSVVTSLLVFFAIITLVIILQLINGIVNYIRQLRTTRLLYFDTVTGGNNWIYFEGRSEREIRKGSNKSKTYAIIDLTLMKYRQYCSLHGVEQGEHLLQRIYERFNKVITRKELCVRNEKSSFVLMLELDKNDKDTTMLQSRLRKMCSIFPGCTFHIGVFLVEPVDANSKETRLRFQINSATNKAGVARGTISEDEGNKIVFFNHEMWEKQIWENKVIESMKAAMDNEEFQVYIQPKMHPSTGKMVGAEALVRWISPTEGFISPGKFVPIFEKTGFVTSLDDYMISHVAKLQAGWLEQGKKIVPISVNVSRAHFAQENLAEHIRDLVDEYNVPHEFIEIELTESAFFDDKQTLLRIVNRLQSYGFEVSMDDFGSGYSSLNSLKDLPLNVLKLDAEFFRGQDNEHRGEIVVAEAISLAKQLNMRIVAEGIEKKEQVEFLEQQNCDMIQGFYFAKPMPADEYETYFEE